MADWHILHLKFDPMIDADKLERLTVNLKKKDYDFPGENITRTGTYRYHGDPVRWRSPLISKGELIRTLEEFGIVGHGWFVRKDTYPGNLHVDADDQFTFGGGFPEIDAAAKWERERKRLASDIDLCERALLETARLTPLDLEQLRSAALLLRAADERFQAHKMESQKESE